MQTCKNLLVVWQILIYCVCRAKSKILLVWHEILWLKSEEQIREKKNRFNQGWMSLWSFWLVQKKNTKSDEWNESFRRIHEVLYSTQIESDSQFFFGLILPVTSTHVWTVRNLWQQKVVSIPRISLLDYFSFGRRFFQCQRNAAKLCEIRKCDDTYSYLHYTKDIILQCTTYCRFLFFWSSIFYLLAPTYFNYVHVRRWTESSRPLKFVSIR